MNELDLNALILEAGRHEPDGKFCVMEAVAFLANESWSDHPKCACPVISAFLRPLNDSMPDNYRQQLKQFIYPLLNSKLTLDVEIKRVLFLADWCQQFTAGYAAAADYASHAVAAATAAARYATTRYATVAASYAAAAAISHAAATWDECLYAVKSVLMITS